LSTGVTGTLPTTNGGTGLTSFTSGGVVYASSGSALSTGSALTFDGTNLGLGVTPIASTYSGYKFFWIASQGGISSDTVSNGALEITNNAYRAVSSAFTYINSFAATKYAQYRGEHKWLNAPPGTAGNAIPFTQAMTLDASGYLTIPAVYGRTVTTPRNVFIDSSGNLGGISSTRASKTNISQLDTASWIYELNPVTFNYLKKDEEGEYLEEFEEEQQFGLIAEEVELVKPELCIYTDDKVSGIHYDRMIAPLIKAIQELKASNDALTASIAQLEAK